MTPDDLEASTASATIGLAVAAASFAAGGLICVFSVLALSRDRRREKVGPAESRPTAGAEDGLSPAASSAEVEPARPRP